MRKIINEKPGTIYGYWKVLKFHKIDKHSDARWWCQCTICGSTYSVKGFALRNSSSTKCTKCAAKMRRY